VLSYEETSRKKKEEEKTPALGEGRMSKRGRPEPGATKRGRGPASGPATVSGLGCREHAVVVDNEAAYKLFRKLAQGTCSAERLTAREFDELLDAFRDLVQREAAATAKEMHLLKQLAFRVRRFGVFFFSRSLFFF
jgi:hypothetical protein